MITKLEELNTSNYPTWCPGCGNFGVWIAMKNAITALGLDPEKVLIVYGIGCSCNGNNDINTYVFHSLHGRPVPVATAAKLANHGLTVIAVSGDGDAYGIGLNHFIQGMRRNIDITYIVNDNRLYSLTTGQASPTTPKGTKTKSTPSGSLETPLNPIALALSSDCTFVSRGFAGNVKHLTDLLIKAIRHKGFSLVETLQPCVTLNKDNNFQFYFQRVYDLQKEGFLPNDKRKAYDKALEAEKIPIGLFYEDSRLSYNDELEQLKEKPLVQQNLSNIDITQNMQELV